MMSPMMSCDPLVMSLTMTKRKEVVTFLRRPMTNTDVIRNMLDLFNRMVFREWIFDCNVLSG